jgi:hypothetical protein
LRRPGALTLIVVGIAIGGVIGAVTTRKIEMTALPQLVAAFHSLVGLAAVFVAIAAFYAPEAYDIGTRGNIRVGSLIQWGTGAPLPLPPPCNTLPPGRQPPDLLGIAIEAAPFQEFRQRLPPPAPAARPHSGGPQRAFGSGVKLSCPTRGAAPSRLRLRHGPTRPWPPTRVRPRPWHQRQECPTVLEALLRPISRWPPNSDARFRARFSPRRHSPRAKSVRECGPCRPREGAGIRHLPSSGDP